MRAASRVPRLTAAFLSTWVLLVGAPAALAQSPSPEAPNEAGARADDDLTLVVGTRFVAPAKAGASPRAQFTDARIPLSAFNETDHCVDQRALEIAMDYFNNLGHALGKAGHFYFVPDAELEKSASMCERLHGRPPRAWVTRTTKVIAFGKVLPTADAPALERALR